MSIIDKVVHYLNDVLVSLDIAPIHRVGAKPKSKSKDVHDESNINV